MPHVMRVLLNRHMENHGIFSGQSLDTHGAVHTSRSHAESHEPGVYLQQELPRLRHQCPCSIRLNDWHHDASAPMVCLTEPLRHVYEHTLHCITWTLRGAGPG